MSSQLKNSPHLIPVTYLQELPALIPSLSLDNLFHVSKGYWAKKRVEGYGPKYIKVGSKVLYPKDQVIAWVNEKLITSTSEE